MIRNHSFAKDLFRNIANGTNLEGLGKSSGLILQLSPLPLRLRQTLSQQLQSLLQHLSLSFSLDMLSLRFLEFFKGSTLVPLSSG